MRDIEWLEQHFGLTYGYMGAHRVATIEERHGGGYHVHINIIPITGGERTLRLPASSAEKAKLVAAQRIAKFINTFLREVGEYAA
jgi:hypothetical protein